MEISKMLIDVEDVVPIPRSISPNIILPVSDPSPSTRLDSRLLPEKNTPEQSIPSPLTPPVQASSPETQTDEDKHSGQMLVDPPPAADLEESSNLIKDLKIDTGEYESTNPTVEPKKKLVRKPRGPYKKRQPRTQRSPSPTVAADGNSSDEDSTVYCVCRTGDDGRWMIGCDFCDDWFHGSCIDMDETKAKLVVTFACPPCRQKGKLPVWRRKCRLPGCYNPLSSDRSKSSPSKYCCKEHGRLFMQKQLECLVGIAKPELSALVKSTKNIKSFHSLGSELPELSEQQILSKLDQYLVSQINQEKYLLKEQCSYLEHRKKYIKLAKDRSKRVSEEIAQEQGVKKRDICGIDELFIIENKELINERATLDSIPGREGICLNEKRKCLKHSGWASLVVDETLLQEKQCGAKLEALDKKLDDLYYQARICILEIE